MANADLLLWQQLIAGDSKALDALFEKHWESLFQFAFKILKSKEVSEEIVQDLFVHIWKKKETLPVVSSINGYLFTATRNRCLNQLAAQKKDLLELQESMLKPSPYTAEEKTHTSDFQKTLAMSKAALPKKTQEVFRLYNEEHLTIAEIAAHTKRSPQTVRNQLNASVKKLKIYFSHFFPTNS